MAGRNTKALVALIGIGKNGNRTRVRFPSIAPTGIERLNADNLLQRDFVLSRHSSRQEFLDCIGQTTDGFRVSSLLKSSLYGLLLARNFRRHDSDRQTI